MSDHAWRWAASFRVVARQAAAAVCGFRFFVCGSDLMKTKRWAMLAGGMMLLGLLLLVTPAVAEDVGETCGNVLDDVAVAACARAIRSGGHNAHRLAVLYGNRCAAYINNAKTDEALSDCNQAIQLDPKNAVAYANRCAAHINKGVAGFTARHEPSRAAEARLSR